MKWIIILGFLLAMGMSSHCHGQQGGKLENDAIGWSWRVADGKLRPVSVEDKLNKATLSLAGDCFELILGNGDVVKASEFKMEGAPREQVIEPEMDSPILAHHFRRRAVETRFSNAGKGLSADWCVTLGDGANYIREELTLGAVGKDVLVEKIILLKERIPEVTTIGAVDGSPAVAGNFFIGYEHPMARNTVDGANTLLCSFSRRAVLKAGEMLKQSCVIGVAPEGQMRRRFLAYVERERPRPYQPFLHYNSWFDISWDTRKYNEGECLEVINRIGREMVEQRGVRMDSFLFDDGWDDNRTLWKFHAGFRNGFVPLREAAQKYHAGVGVWVSPFGGYHEAREQRLEYGRKEGFETNGFGFSLAGPKYFERFRDICRGMILDFGVNAFKFDGLAVNAKTWDGGLTRDGDAMMRLVADLRALEPDLYISQTTGTWPSPFWLLYVDSTWRGGDDDNFQGKGSWCQQWITYRDAQTYQNVVKGGPLYPLNSLMLHGIILATNAAHLSSMSNRDFSDQVRDFFGSGTQLQEMYLTPAQLDRQNWDDLAEAAAWSRANADTLVDTHWIGGDPSRGEVYGWASWSPGKAILVLRNPDDQAATFSVDVAKLFELPPGDKGLYRMRSPWRADQAVSPVELRAGQPLPFTLQPFEVRVLESGG